MPNRDRAAPLPASLPSMAAQAERLLELRTRQLAARRGRRQAAAAPLPPVLACAVGEALYGVPLAAVARVLPLGPLAPLPGSPPALLGLHGQAGQVHAVLDLGLALGAAPHAPSPAVGGHLLLLREAPRRFALCVGRVLRVAEPLPLSGAAAEAAPGLAPGRALAGHALLPGERGAAPRLMGLVALERLLLPYRADGPADPGPASPILAAQPTGA